MNRLKQRNSYSTQRNTHMNKIALTLAVLAGLSTAAFASQRNQDPDHVFGKGGFATEIVTTGTNVQGAAVVYDGGSTGNSAFDAQLRNMEIQSQSNRK
jgi:hypothetical protein